MQASSYTCDHSVKYLTTIMKWTLDWAPSGLDNSTLTLCFSRPPSRSPLQKAACCANLLFCIGCARVHFRKQLAVLTYCSVLAVPESTSESSLLC
ncbi:hypothetical protein PoB_001589600 [Plakobranchus ocellatus]|uniref:Uncharacterized protein n=1 Tax=Plakobranchus ocellatus TaxID=259542 RepID=A0AAV3YQG6_9GAST|nr:hypothetical protein PoB_001589600 [Plakobranchus ocellatus]